MEIILIALAFACGLICGWIALPEPVWLREFWTARGWARRVPPR